MTLTAIKGTSRLEQMQGQKSPTGDSSHAASDLFAHVVHAFRLGLNDTGYMEGQNAIATTIPPMLLARADEVIE